MNGLQTHEKYGPTISISDKQNGVLFRFAQTLVGGNAEEADAYVHDFLNIFPSMPGYSEWLDIPSKERKNSPGGGLRAFLEKFIQEKKTVSTEYIEEPITTAEVRKTRNRLLQIGSIFPLTVAGAFAFGAAGGFSGTKSQENDFVGSDVGPITQYEPAVVSDEYPSIEEIEKQNRLIIQEQEAAMEAAGSSPGKYTFQEGDSLASVIKEYYNIDINEAMGRDVAELFDLDPFKLDEIPLGKTIDLPTPRDVSFTFYPPGP